MAQESNDTSAPGGAFKIQRLAISVNVILQVLIVFAIVAMVNWVAFRQYKRWDLSRNHKYELSPMTRNLLGSLKEPVKAILFFPQAQILTEDVTSLLQEYQYASGRKLTIETVEPYKNLSRAKELAEKYKFGANDNIVILDYKDRSKFVSALEMAEFDTSGQSMGQGPTVRAFKGEQALTSALLELTEEKQNKVYVLAGHGEPDPKSAQVSVFRAYAQRQNLKVEALNLSNVDAVPEDASALMIFGPLIDFSEREIKLVGDYWEEKKGRLYILLNPAGKTVRLNTWLYEHGITPQGDRVLKTGTVAGPDETGTVGVRAVTMTSPAAAYAAGGKPVTKDVAGMNTQMLGPVESLLVETARAQMMKFRITPVIVAAEGYWGETEFVAGETRIAFFDPKKDHMGPLTIGAAVEKGALDDPRVKVDTARMIVVGGSNFLTDDGLKMAPIGINFAVNSLNWVLNREYLAGIPPRPNEAVRLELDDLQMGKLLVAVLVIIPAMVAVIGTGTWWQRRH